MSQVELPDPASVPEGNGVDGLGHRPDVAAAIKAFVDRGPFGVAVFDCDLRFLLVSPGLATLHGQAAHELEGKRIEEVLPRPYGDLAAQPLRQVLASGTPIIDLETWGTFADPAAERCFTSSFHRLDDASGTPLGVLVLLTETTELRYAASAARWATEQLELFQALTEALAGRDSVVEVTQMALERAAQAVGASAAMIAGFDDRRAVLAPLATTGLCDELLELLQQPADLHAPLPHCTTLASRTITLWRSRRARDLDYPHLVRYRSDHQAWAFVPLMVRDRRIGVVVFAWRLDRDFQEGDVALVNSVGRQCALALEQARILAAERESRRATEFLVEVTRFVVEGLDAGVFALSNGNRILTVNRQFFELMGLPAESVELGGDATTLLSPCLARVRDPSAVSRHLELIRQHPSESVGLDFEMTDGRVLTCRSTPIVDRRGEVLGRVWYMRDDTKRRASEAEQRHAIDELLARHEHKAFLLRAAEIVSQGDTYSEILKRLAEVAVPVLADICLVDTLTMEGGVVRRAARHADPAFQPLVDELGANYAPDPSGLHPSVEVMHSGRARWSGTMTDEFLRRTSRDEHHFELLKRLEFTSYMTLPLVADKQILGSITLVSAGSGRRFGPGDVALAEEFTACVAQVVGTARRNESARHASHTLQASLLPDLLPAVPGLSLVVRYLPASDNDVGGDFYDVIAGSGPTTVVIGDVAGHDMTAAAVMGKVRTAARVLAGHSAGPGHLIEMLRHGWDNLELERMVTLLVVNIDARSGNFRVASAGHPPPLLVRDGSPRLLDIKPSTPLGAPSAAVTEWSGTLCRDDTLLLYTDGLVEDRRRRYLAGIGDLLRLAAGRCSPTVLCDRLLDGLVPDETHHDDDVAMVAMCLEPSTGLKPSTPAAPKTSP